MTTRKTEKGKSQLPEDARRELDEGLGRVVDFHERLRLLAFEARERLAST